MSRPNPQVFLTCQDPKNASGIEILEAVAYYAVLYQARPFNLRKWLNLELKSLTGYAAKYPKTVFANRAHAYNLADRLNKMFSTEDFSVREIY